MSFNSLKIDELLEKVEDLESENANLKAQLAAAEKNYQDLILQVGKKTPGETRHETAKRYLQQAETSDNVPQQAKDATKEK